MSLNKRVRILLLSISVIAGIVLVSFGTTYTYWNSTPADKTCASCHEIAIRVHSFSMSTHRNLQCKECHGTALSNGIHSLKEKGMMVVNHALNRNTENIRMSEEQVLGVMDNCKRCHTAEFSKWTSGGHSIDYQHVFLNKKHNSTEQLNYDCLRCHGMFFEGDVSEIVQPMSIKGPWELKNMEIANRTAIPCMACHQIHQNGSPRTKPDYANPKDIFYHKDSARTGLTFYDRHEKVNYSMAELPKLKFWDGDSTIKVSNDIRMRNCVQCHAPNARHQAGTSDDRTPRGVHEGLSCLACHEAHSNDARNSCIKCHPAISNCKLDVTKMNTSFANKESQHNIHFVSCADCHNGIEQKKLNLRAN